MDVPTPPKPHPVQGIKGLAATAKKKPAVTIAIVAGILLAAYLIRRKQNAANANAAADAATPALDYQGTSGTVGPYSPSTGAVDTGGSYFPDPSQGAAVVPGGTSPYVPGADPLPPVIMPIWWPIGGGGLPNGPYANPAPPPDPAPYVAPDPPPAPPPSNGGGSPHVVTGSPQPAGSPWPQYPFAGPHGWYRVVNVPSGQHKGRWHYYGPNDHPKVKVG